MNEHSIKHVLITGASGLIGSRLTEILVSNGYSVSHLSRSKKKSAVKTFVWDVKKFRIEEGALEGVDAIIHLAGAGVADRRWTPNRKKEILESRTRSTALLVHTLASKPHHVKVFVAASGMSYYGTTVSDRIFTEADPPATDFLASVTTQWEQETDKLQSLPVRVVKFRIGVVLSEKGGALLPIVRSIAWMAGAPMGTGKQFLSWIHIDDLCYMFVHAIKNSAMTGAYNAVSPNPVTNLELTRAIARILKKPLLLPCIPSFMLKLLLGEMSMMVLEGSRLSAEKIKSTGFTFRFDTLNDALNDLLKERRQVTFAEK